MNMASLTNLYLSREGRIGRMTFWLGLVGLAVFGILISVLVMPLVGLGMMADSASLITASGDPAEITRIMNEAMGRSSWASLLLFVVFVFPASALFIKRRHDRNDGGMVVWIYFGLSLVVVLLQVTGLGFSLVDMGGFQVPLPNLLTTVLSGALFLTGLYLLVVCGFLKGTDGNNNYGPDPTGGE